MAFFDQDDELNQREPHEMQVFVSALGAIGEDNIAKKAFVAVHLAESSLEPAILLSTWVTDNLDEPDTEEEFDFNEWYLSQTVPIAPQQARALAFSLLRLADGLDIEIERGLYGDQGVRPHSVYFSDPLL